MTEQELYIAGKLAELSFEISKLITTEPALENAFRYAKTIDFSGKGFKCASAAAIKRSVDVQAFSDPKYAAGMKKIESLYSKFDSIKKQMEALPK